MIRSTPPLTEAPPPGVRDLRAEKERRPESLRRHRSEEAIDPSKGTARSEWRRVWMALPFFAAFVACASSPPPTARMASAEAAVRAAHDVGAERVPEAQLHVKLAEEQIARARALINSGENQRADLMLQRANADAELGVALAREDTTRDRAQRIIDQTHDLQQRTPQPDEHQDEHQMEER